jgi:hypothetical protein
MFKINSLQRKKIIKLRQLAFRGIFLFQSTKLAQDQVLGLHGVVDLYKASDEKLNNTRFYKYLVPLLELNPFRMIPEDCMRDIDSKFFKKLTPKEPEL